MDSPPAQGFAGAVPLLENRAQRRARERAQRKGILLPGEGNHAPQQPSEMDPLVGIGHVADQHIEHIFYMSMIGLLHYRLPVLRNRVIMAQGDAGHLDVARNKVARDFLSSPLQWLFWIDTDMAFQPREFDMVMEAADEDTAPFVSGLYYSAGNPNPHPVAFRNRLRPEDGMVHAEPIAEPEGDGVEEVDGVGFGFTVIHRTVFERVAEAFGPTHPHRPWFDCSDFGPYQEPPSEDLSLCHRVRALDIPILVHTGARVGHIKSAVVMGRRLQP